MTTGTVGDSSDGNYRLCDLSDEEVHFSRDPLNSDHYYSYDKNNANLGLVGPISPTGANSFVDLSTGGGSCTRQSGPEIDHQNLDQITSTRLLNYLSCKIRWGSNYLNASKIVGQYLLGITIQNWSEFFNTSRMMKAPCTRQQLTRRLLANLSYFQGNYLCVSIVLVIYCILTSPLLLLAIVIYLFALYLVTARSAFGKQTKIFGHRLNLHQQYSFITMLALPPLWIAGAPGALFWVIGASFFVVGLHASMYANERALVEELPASSSVPGPQHRSSAHWANAKSSRTGSCSTSGSKQLRVDSPRGSEEINSSSLYYNHYAKSTGAITQRISQETHSGAQTHSLMSSYQGPSSIESAPMKKHSGSGYMPLVLSQWISFGGGSGSNFGSVNDVNARDTNRGIDHYRTPEIKIISQDYAGLGRVYEV